VEAKKRGAAHQNDEITRALLAAAATNTSADALGKTSAMLASPQDRGLRAPANGASKAQSSTVRMTSVSAPTAASTSLDQYSKQPPTLALETEKSRPVTGMQMLKAMVEQHSSSEPAQEVKERPVAGYAMASMMSRAAENMRAAARSKAAENLASKASKPTATTTGSTDAPAGVKQPEMQMYLGKIPTGTSEGLILAECGKYGAVAGCEYCADNGDLLEGGWALVSFDTAEMAQFAVQRMARRVSLFGAAEPLEVRLGVPEDAERVEQLHAKAAEPAEEAEEPPPEEAASAGDAAPAAEVREVRNVREVREPRKVQHDRSHQHPRRRQSPLFRSRSRRHRKLQRKRVRHRAGRVRLRSPSQSSCSGSRSSRSASASRSERNLKRLGGFDQMHQTESSTALANPANAVPSGGRQVGTRGSWAEFSISDGRSYYLNVLTGEKTWTRPAGFDTLASRRGAFGMSASVPPGLGHSNVYVGCLPAGLNDMTFRQLFDSFGNIISIKVVSDAYYGFVKFSNVHEAQAAIDAMNGFVCNGVHLAVRFANKDRG